MAVKRKLGGRGPAIATAALATVLMLAPTAASATPSIWVQCDGLPKPESTATTVARSTAALLLSGVLIGALLLPEDATGAPVASGPEGVRACTEALADPALEPFWERRVSILYNRARHRLDSNDSTGAMADLALIRESASAQTSDVLFSRSLGVSTQLLEATLLAKAGRIDEARQLAVQAADARPYSLIVQSRALTFLNREATPSPGALRIGARLAQLDSARASSLATYLDTTDDAEAAANEWERALAMSAESPLFEAAMRLERPPSRPTKLDPLILTRAALAFARAGRVERARELLASPTLQPLEAAPVASVAEPTGSGTAAGRSRQELANAADDRRWEARMLEMESSARRLFPLIKAVIAERTGDTASAISHVQQNFTDLPAEMASVELARRLSELPDGAAQIPGFMVDGIARRARPAPADRFKDLETRSVFDDLPPLQLLKRNERYRRSDGVRVVAELRDVANSRPGETRITYRGEADSFAADEMLLLRAAELARERGTTGFLVRQQASRIRYETGVPSIPVLTLPAWLVVEFVDVDAPPAGLAPYQARFMRADEVIAALKPVYIDLPAQMDAARRRR